MEHLIILRAELIRSYFGKTKTPMYWKRLEVLNKQIKSLES